MHYTYMVWISSALLEQDQQGHADEIEDLKNIVSKLEASLGDKQAENSELKSSIKVQKRKCKKLLEQVNHSESVPCIYVMEVYRLNS